MRKTILAAAAAVLAWGVAKTASAQQTNDVTQQPLAGSYQLQQPLTGTYQLQQPLTGSYQAQQPLTGTSSLDQPLAGTGALQQPLTGTGALQQPLTGTSSLPESFLDSSALDSAIMGNFGTQQSVPNYVQPLPQSSVQPPPVGNFNLQQPLIGTTPSTQPGQ